MSTKPSRSLAFLVALGTAALGGCPSTPAGSDAGVSPDAPLPGGDAGPLATPATYAFDSRFAPGTSSVAYGGQTARQVLIRDVSSVIGSLTDLIDRGVLTPAEGDIVASLDLYYGADAASRASEPILLTTDPQALQSTHGELSMTATLVDKLAGNDASTDYTDFSGTAFRGWSDASFAANGGSITTPAGLVLAIFENVEANAIARGEGTMRTGPDGEDLPVHVTEQGVDLEELTEKFLLMAIAYHQVADDYLDDQSEDPGKGLLADNVVQIEGQPYTELEHGWDEGYGYLGAPPDLSSYTAADLADGTPWRDTSGDGRIDLRSELAFSHAVYLAQRDVGSAATARTTFLADIDLAFRTGRAILTGAGGALSPAQLDALRVQRDRVLEVWEQAIVATIVHYLNELLLQTSLYGAAGYDFFENCSAFSEMKGFALGLQFNPRSPVLARFEELHTLLGDHPVLGDASAADRMAYMQRLRDARALLAMVYGIDPANLGDDVGNGGW